MENNLINFQTFQFNQDFQDNRTYYFYPQSNVFINNSININNTGDINNTNNTNPPNNANNKRSFSFDEEIDFDLTNQDIISDSFQPLKKSNSKSSISSDSSKSSVSTKSSSKTSKPSKKDKILSLPRILKYDIRRQYGIMLLNTLNSYDFSLLLSFLSRYCVPKVKLSRFLKDCSVYNPTFTSFNNCKENNTTFHLIGKELIACYFSSLNKISPDKVCGFKSQNILTRTDTDISKIFARFTVRGTKIYDISLPKLVGDLADKFGKMFNIDINSEEFSRQFSDIRFEKKSIGYNEIKLEYMNQAEDEVTQFTKQVFPSIFTKSPINSNDQSKSFEVPSSLFKPCHIRTLIDHFDPTKPYLDSNNRIQSFLKTPGTICVDANMIINVNADKRIIGIEFR